MLTFWLYLTKEISEVRSHSRFLTSSKLIEYLSGKIRPKLVTSCHPVNIARRRHVAILILMTATNENLTSEIVIDRRWSIKMIHILSGFIPLNTDGCQLVVVKYSFF